MVADESFTIAKIAKTLKVNKSTISWELKRNSARKQEYKIK